ncbi:glycoside hydrolase family 10 protein [Gloeobacter kilaueensis]|uniref:Glycosyl hydrolase-like 10 domain-containing protein n=1 Tax=Gloeobacter kilaueensis (strain ATCC BAA-2537 / CCAP 1431/1 / ULC 316 / JS1) TaxID=1183438 RepID=U5QJG0_GLOK1|nr:family 10 glycosylhydrolase [Gloeobacter kilaueensis]AGY57759.1 hypothetical protein GKIL_1513 [Gloeobacter kilaueensis JS1]
MSALRGVWLTNVGSAVLHSRQAIVEAMQLLADAGFNAVFPVVWNKGFTLYPSRVMGEHFGVEIDPLYAEQGRDPLAEVIEEAGRAGIRTVIPWFEYGFACAARADGGHILAARPEWRACERGGALLVKNGLAWMNAFDPQVQAFLIDLIVEVAENYPVQGVQGCDRLPGLPVEGGYDPLTLRRYAAATGREVPFDPQERRWLQWRADELTAFLERLRMCIKAVRSDLLLSLAPAVYPFSLTHLLQDVKAWSEQELFDLLHPQVYRENFRAYKVEIDKFGRYLSSAALERTAPGIALKANGTELSREDLLRCVALNRDRKLLGEVFFFYEGLRADGGSKAHWLGNGPYAPS